MAKAIFARQWKKPVKTGKKTGNKSSTLNWIESTPV